MSIRQILNNKKKFNRIARVVFNSVDKDGSGLIDMNEFGLVMSTISKDMSLPMPTKKEIKEVFSMLDTDNSGIISYEEFKVLIKAILESLE
jgi:Ca2+-binding EF-hand superfamily protein